MYSLKDISVIIPTYNRAHDIKETLNALRPHIRQLREVLIIDQSPTRETQRVVRTYKQKNIRYLFSSPPSITIARNSGVRRASERARLICFLDDDVSVKKGYFEAILEVFNTQPHAVAVAGYTKQQPLARMHLLENVAKKFFFLAHLEQKERARIISSYGNTYPATLHTVINAHWLPGVNMVFKREVFREQQFDEHLLGYTVAEDIDFTYRLFQRYPRGLFLTPHAPLTHRISDVERTPTKKMSYINQADHFYFFFKNLASSPLHWLIFAWSLAGIALLRTLNLIISPTERNCLKWHFFFSSLFYCFMNVKKIRQGHVRNFIQEHR